jgi:hypothetical protein
MQYLQIVAQVPNRNANEVYSIMCDFESYPKNSKAVHSVTTQVLPDGRTFQTS